METLPVCLIIALLILRSMFLSESTSIAGGSMRRNLQSWIPKVIVRVIYELLQSAIVLPCLNSGIGMDIHGESKAL